MPLREVLHSAASWARLGGHSSAQIPLEVCGLLQGVVAGSGHQDRVAAPGGDLDGGAVCVDVLDEGNRSCGPRSR